MSEVLDLTIKFADELLRHQIYFPVMLELASLLVLAPLTAQFVVWREHHRWRLIRTEVVERVIDDLSRLMEAFAAFAVALPGKDKLVEQYENTLTRIEIEATQERSRYRHFEEKGLEVSLGEYEILGIYPPKIVLAENFVRVNADATRTYIARLEGCLSKYAFCLSPEMVHSISMAFSPDRTIAVQGRLSDGGGLVLLDRIVAGPTDLLFAPSLSLLSDGLRDFTACVENDLLEHPGQRADAEYLFQRIPVLRLDIVVEQMRRLTRLCGAGTGTRTALENKIGAMLVDYKKSMVDKRFVDFRRLLIDLDSVEREYHRNAKKALETLRERQILNEVK